MKTIKKSSIAIFSDYPDPDVIRIDNTYYMVSTTMHFMPGCVILRSYNLLDWEIIKYVYQTLEETPGQNLEDNQGIYAKGMWAASLRYNNGIFYICFVANDTGKTYLFTSDSIEGEWKKSEIQGFYHDASLLFDDDKVYIVSGNTNIRLVELDKELTAPKKNGIDKIIITDKSDFILGYEGSHFYKINNKYYIFFIHWPKGKYRTQSCFVSDNILGPYTGCDVLCSDLHNWKSGVAQGGIVDDINGNYYAMLFQDHGALGRIPVLVNVSFYNNKIIFGKKGKVPAKIKTIDNKPDYKYQKLWCNDFYDEKTNKLLLPWQFNHNPDYKNICFSTKDTKQIFSIKTDQIVKNFCLCKNTLTQRAYSHKSSATVKVDFSKINNGDYCGFGVLQGNYAYICSTKEKSNLKICLMDRKSPVNKYKVSDVDLEEPICKKQLLINQTYVFFKIRFILSYKKQIALFYYSLNGKKYHKFGEKSLEFTLDHFTGCRFALFNYSTIMKGGIAEFTEFNYEK